METLKRAVKEIAYTRDYTPLPTLQRSLIPILSFASALYGLCLSIRYSLYNYGLFRKHRLPVPVISVGNLTWGGSGKTPMVEYLALWLANSGISPLILTRGYAGGDEVNMLRRHLVGRSIKVGVGANRAAIAACFFERYGYIDPRSNMSSSNHGPKKMENDLCSVKIGAVILDDGMQHWKLQRDVEVAMVNGLTQWGSRKLLPLGPLREPLTELKRADVAVVHHADLVSEQDLKDMTLFMRGIKETIVVVFTKMAPSCFFNVGNANSIIPLEALHNKVVLCVSAIGSAEAFVQTVQKLGAYNVYRIDYSDHHKFLEKDIAAIRVKLNDLEKKFGSKPIVVVTEKDYDRDRMVFTNLDGYEVLVLCSQLQIMDCEEGCSEHRFKRLLKEKLVVNQAPGQVSSVLRG